MVGIVRFGQKALPPSGFILKAIIQGSATFVEQEITPLEIDAEGYTVEIQPEAKDSTIAALQLTATTLYVAGFSWVVKALQYEQRISILVGLRNHLETLTTAEQMAMAQDDLRATTQLLKEMNTAPPLPNPEGATWMERALSEPDYFKAGTREVKAFHPNTIEYIRNPELWMSQIPDEWGSRGGYTQDPFTGKLYPVGEHPNMNMVAIDGAKLPTQSTTALSLQTEGVTVSAIDEQIELFLQRNKRVLSRPDTYIGGWESGGELYIEISRSIDNTDEAIRLGKMFDQEGIMNLGQKGYMSTGGKDKLVQTTRAFIIDNLDTINVDDSFKILDNSQSTLGSAEGRKAVDTFFKSDDLFQIGESLDEITKLQVELAEQSTTSSRWSAFTKKGLFRGRPMKPTSIEGAKEIEKILVKQMVEKRLKLINQITEIELASQKSLTARLFTRIGGAGGRVVQVTTGSKTAVLTGKTVGSKVGLVVSKLLVYDTAIWLAFGGVDYLMNQTESFGFAHIPESEQELLGIDLGERWGWSPLGQLIEWGFEALLPEEVEGFMEQMWSAVETAIVSNDNLNDVFIEIINFFFTFNIRIFPSDESSIISDSIRKIAPEIALMTPSIVVSLLILKIVGHEVRFWIDKARLP